MYLIISYIIYKKLYTVNIMYDNTKDFAKQFLRKIFDNTI